MNFWIVLLSFPWKFVQFMDWGSTSGFIVGLLELGKFTPWSLSVPCKPARAYGAVSRASQCLHRGAQRAELCLFAWQSLLLAASFAVTLDTSPRSITGNLFVLWKKGWSRFWRLKEKSSVHIRVHRCELWAKAVASLHASAGCPALGSGKERILHPHFSQSEQ